MLSKVVSASAAARAHGARGSTLSLADETRARAHAGARSAKTLRIIMSRTISRVALMTVIVKCMYIIHVFYALHSYTCIVCVPAAVQFGQDCWCCEFF